MRFFYLFLMLNFFLAISTIHAKNTSVNNEPSLRATSSYSNASVLSTGKWVKIKVDHTGIYKLTYESLRDMGFSNPGNIQIYGYGGWMLDENFANYKIDDLPQLSVWVEKGSDNVFNSGDYMLFYARGPLKWEYNTSLREFVHTNHPYSNYGYYFITESAVPAKQMGVQASLDDFSKEINSFNDYVVHEKESVSIGRVGREFYGESFAADNNQSFTLSTPGIISDISGKINVNFIAKTATATPLTVKVNGVNSLTKNVPKYDDDHTDMAKDVTVTGTWTGAKQNENIVNVVYAGVQHTNARLNYIRLNYDRTLKLYNDPFVMFRQTSAVGSNAKYNVANANSNVRIWDISDIENIKQVESSISGNVLSFTANSSSLQEFVAVDISRKNDYPEPEFEGVVVNQNLHALDHTDMVIITHADFITQADRLADFHRTHDGLKVYVVLADQIYNEFSSGTPDASAYRRLMKMFYDRGKASGNGDNLPKYLLLFGDGAFDNKEILSDWSVFGKANYLMTFQSENSISTTSTYSTDDYFGFLEDTGINHQANRLDIGIGRFPVKTLQEATHVVDKTIKYVTEGELSPWKNKVCFVADDGDDKLHMYQADSVARRFFQDGNKNFELSKVYLENFKIDNYSSESRFPDAKKKFFDLMESGVFLVNYTGHGSEVQLAGTVDRFFQMKDIVGLKNKRLPLFITATCSFSHYDDYYTAGGEELLLNPDGGAIALFSTTRVVNSSPNWKINLAFSDNLFKKDDNGHNLSLGQVSKLAKRQLGNELNKLNYILLGDPAIKLPYPEYKITVTKINGENASDEGPAISLNAGMEVKMEGIVGETTGSIASDYSGMVHVDLFDSKELMNLIIKPKKVNGVEVKDTTYIYYQAKKLFSGRASVVNGKFSISFIIPKDVSYSNEAGKINMYAVDNTHGNEAQGYFDNIMIGRSNNYPALSDVNPPVISSVYIGNADFQSGDKVKNQSVFVAEVEDKETGINVSGAMGRDALLIIDDASHSTYKLNSCFEGEPGNSRKGRFVFTMPDLSAGKHELQFKVWDIMNNSKISEKISFEIAETVVAKDFDLTAITENDAVTFFIDNNTQLKDLEVYVEIYDFAGDLVWNNSQKINTDLLKSFPVKWNKTGNNLKQINPGLYTYKAVISSAEGTRSTDIKKLIIR